MAIIMTAHTNTTTEPATESAGAKLMLLLKSVVLILFSVLLYKSNHKKNSHRLIPVRVSTVLFKSISTTATSHTAADNYGDGNNNNAGNVVESSLHFFPVSFENAF